MLLSKLDYDGIKDSALNWFESYLTNRTQYVNCNGISSSIRKIETAVPQGSILGPLLFMIYMHDIHTVSNNLNFILYADDTTLNSPMCSFTRGCGGNIDIVSTLSIQNWTKFLTGLPWTNYFTLVYGLHSSFSSIWLYLNTSIIVMSLFFLDISPRENETYFIVYCYEVYMYDQYLMCQSFQWCDSVYRI